MGDVQSQETSILTAESHLVVRKTSGGEGDSTEGWTQHYFPNPGQWRDVTPTPGLSGLVLCGHSHCLCSVHLFCHFVFNIFRPRQVTGG
jgi:hypothetical protein